MSKRNDLIRQRKKELLELGYKPGIVNLAMDWAASCAEGMATYALKEDIEGNTSPSFEELTVTFLPQYLRDAEKWIRSFGHEPGEVKQEA